MIGLPLIVKVQLDGEDMSTRICERVEESCNLGLTSLDGWPTRWEKTMASIDQVVETRSEQLGQPRYPKQTRVEGPGTRSKCHI
jgi:hypothetical protein